MKLQKDLREFIALLNSLKVEYLIVGGHAVAFHGHPRFTGDIDFLIRPVTPNVKRLMETLHAFGFAELDLSPDDFIQPNAVVQLGRPPNRIDLLTSISGVDFEDAWENRIAGQLDGIDVFFLGLDSLLKNKAATGRDKDLVDLKKLKSILQKSQEPET